MERQTEDLIVTLAGYKDRMDRFFSYIPGMSSRIGNHIDFPNYEKDELVEIAQVTVTFATVISVTVSFVTFTPSWSSFHLYSAVVVGLCA
jgi:hypothetical protein